MNINSGELVGIPEDMRDLLDNLTDEDPVPKGMFPEADKLGTVKRKDIVTLSVGDTVEVKGCPCLVVHINVGKGRFSLRPQGRMKLT